MKYFTNPKIVNARFVLFSAIYDRWHFEETAGALQNKVSIGKYHIMIMFMGIKYTLHKQLVSL